MSASLLTLLLLSGCNAIPRSAPPVAPPVQYLADTPEPDKPFPPLTNGKLAEWNQAYRAALLSCNLDKASLRSWAVKLNP